MPGSRHTRQRFLALAAALGAAPVAATARPSLNDPLHPGRLERALVLSGGGARGAFQAGIIDYLRSSRQLADGDRLHPYGIVCGTSIGALNGYFVSTGQYGLLRDLWYGIANDDVVRLKKKFAKIADADAGVGTRVAAAMRLILGLTHDDRGVIDGEHLRAWMERYINPSMPVLIPLVWPVTNLTTQSPEYFYLVNRALSDGDRARAQAAIRVTVGPNAVLREATPDLLIDALRASAAIPVAFDPVPLPAADGAGTQYYVDGGVTANTPVSVARIAAVNADIVLLDPPFQSETYKNAFDVGYGVFGAMQRRILEADLRAGFLETFGKRAAIATRSSIASLAGAERIDSSQMRQFVEQLYDSDFYVIRPKHELPVDVVGFDQREKIFETYRSGFEIARDGFAPYAFS